MAASELVATSATTPVRAVELSPAITRVMQFGWLLFQLAALAIVITATPALYDEYQTTCPELYCDRLPHLNAGSAEWLQGLGVRMDHYALAMVTVEWLYMLLWATLGAIIIWKRPRDLVAQILAISSVFIGGNLFLGVLDRSESYVNVAAQISTLITYVSFPLVIGLFPDGRWVPRWSRWLALAGVASATNDALGPNLSPLLEGLVLPASLVIWGGLLAAQVVRYRRVSTVTQRQQTKWLLFGVGLFVFNIVVALVAFVSGLFEHYQVAVVLMCSGSAMLMVVAIGFAVLRYRLFDIDIIINRTLVYGGLSASVVAIYALIVGGLGALLRTESVAISFLAAGVLAVAFQPLRARLQRAVNRLLYGERDEPYAVLAQLGQRLDASLSPETVLPTIAETVSSALKLPYTAIALRHGETDSVVAESGPPPAVAVDRVPLTFQGERVGTLLVAPRAGEPGLSGTDRRLLHDLARQAGVAAHAVRLNTALQRSREQLVATREEERRRLRRDLHDGLGPALASQALTIDTAALLLERDPQTAAELLREAKQQSQSAVQEIRRVVHALRPPALDDLGLAGALREMASHAIGAGLTIVVDAPEPLPSLPAAAEVAAYRIAQEALTNVVRHAGAGWCQVTIEVGGELRLSVSDDGAGIPANRRAGVGLASMRERAEELGGVCVVEPRPSGGTQVVACLPLSYTESARTMGLSLSS